MNLQDIRKEVEKDTQVDRTSLDSESLKIPQIHNKYLNLFHDNRFALHKANQEYKVLEKNKWEYYSGRLSEEELKTFGWEQFPHRILKGDVDRYLNADADLILKQNRILLLEETIAYLESVLKMMSNRHWQIRNAIEWQRFTNGVA